MKKHLVLLHSTLGTPTDLGPIKDQLHQAFSITSPTLGGHGPDSALPNDFRIETFAEELDQHLRSLSKMEVSVFGLGLGGYVALYHKAHYEDSPIQKIVTYGTKFNWSQEFLAKEIHRLNPDEVEQRMPEYAQTLREKHGDKWKVLMRSVAHMVQNLERLDGLTKEDLEDVHIPVLLLVGDEDRVVSKEESVLVKNILKSVQVMTVSHSKHEPEKTNFGEIIRILQQQLT